MNRAAQPQTAALFLCLIKDKAMASDDDIVKTREICFDCSADEVAQALQVLGQLQHLKAQLSPHKCCILVNYNLFDHTLQSIEDLLAAQNLHPDHSFLHKIKRALSEYSEQIQRENLKVPERQQKARQIYSQAYEHHPHGDHDDTPEEWREYK